MDNFSKWSIPLGMLTTLIGGSAWLTTTHNKVDTIEHDLTSFTEQWKVQKEKLSDQVYNQDGRLSRIEGKLDLLIENIRSWRDHAHSNSTGPNR